MRPLRPSCEVLADWAPELSARLGRPVADLLADGLTLRDFPHTAVEVRRDSGMTARFPAAFAVMRPAAARLAVFTEHDGYVEFDLDEEMLVAEISEQLFRLGVD